MSPIQIQLELLVTAHFEWSWLSVKDAFAALNVTFSTLYTLEIN